MVWLPIGSLWRKLRKICREQMFSFRNLDAGTVPRRNELDKLCDYVSECCEMGRPVDIGEAAFTTSLNLLSSTLLSTELTRFNTDASQEIKDVVWRVMKCWGKPNLSDYFPVMKLLDPQGIRKEAKCNFLKLFDIFDGIIDDKLKNKGQTNDMVDTLLEMDEGEQTKLSRDEINHLLLELFVGGTDSTSATVEWAMAELLSDPEKMLMLRKELNDIIGEDSGIQESDIPKLPYLQGVLKETWRLHPVAPLLVTHKAEADVKINGYLVPKGSQMFLNVWAVGRDPNVWPDAESFIPERHLDHDQVGITKGGTGMELIPFGAGRRICPGMLLANRMVPLILGNLVHKFRWNVEGEIDMTDKFGAALHKALPLISIPIKLQPSY